MLLEGGDGGQRGKGRVAVVRAAAAVESVPFHDRRPGPQALPPAGHLRLFVQMPVEQHGVVAGAGDVHEQQRRSARQARHFQLQARHRLLFAPARKLLRRLLHEAPGLPIGVKQRGFVRDLDVLLQFRNDLGFPHLLAIGGQAGVIRGNRLGRGGRHGSVGLRAAVRI